MRVLREWIARLAGTFHARRTDAELREELRLHQELAEEDARRRGVPARDAVRAAAIAIGGASQAMDALRDQRGVPWLDDLRRDTAYAVRALLGARAFAATAVLTLALAIGANTAVFSIIDRVVLRTLPVPDPEQLVILTDPAVGGAAGGLILGERDHVSYLEFDQLRAGMRSFSGMLAAQTYTPLLSAAIDGGAPEEVRSKLVSGNYFAVLGVPAVAGRTFTGDDETGAGSAPYAVISHAFWQRRFGGAGSALETRLRIADADLTIIGVAPPGFLGESVGEAPDVWIPTVMQPQVMPGMNWLSGNLMWLHAIGRLEPGVSRQQAQAEADVVFGGMLRDLSARFTNNPDIAANVLKQHLTLRDASRGVSMLRGAYSVPLFILMGFVALVLAIACASVATLLLARAVERRKELDVRLAVGASSLRIFRQLVTESLVLSAAAGLLGSGIAVAVARLLIATVLGDAQPGVDAGSLSIGLDVRTTAFTSGLCLLTVFVFGLAPAWSAARKPQPGSPGVASQTTMVPPNRAAGHALVAVQVALSVMLLVAAGWFVRTLWNLQAADIGYSRQVAQLGIDFQAGGYERAQLGNVYEDLRERLAGLPGVSAVTYSTSGLLGDNYLPITVDRSGQGGVAKVKGVGPDYFREIGRRIIRGRGIERQDGASTALVCVINEALAALYFGDEDPLGRYVVQGNRRFEIVGVAADAHDTMSYPASFADNLRTAVHPTFYRPVAQPLPQYPLTLQYLLVTDGDPAMAIPFARVAVEAFNPAVTVARASTLEEQIGTLVREERLVAQLATVVGATALLLACIGLYGLLSHVVARRTNEIGIRVALGAQRGTIAGMVLRDVAALVLAGVAIGIPASIACARFVRNQVFGLGAADPETLVTAIAVLVVVAAVAGYLPARRAARIDPLTAIRVE